MAYIDDVAAAVWAYNSRTLVTGTPASPATAAEAMAKAVWEYATRKLVTINSLDVVADGVPFVHMDLTGLSDNLDIVADGVPWIGYQTPAASVVFTPIWWSNILEAI